MNETEIIQDVYYLVEIDSDPWTSTDDEYLTARGLANIAINRWAKYDNTIWNELFVTLTASNILLLGDKVTTTANTYNCPTDFVRPSSFVRIGGGFYDVVPAQKIAELKDSSDRFVYFTGNPKDGYDMNINPNITVESGQTIEYEYYKSVTNFAATTDVTEMSDPYFIVYFIAAHMGEDGINNDFYTMAEARLEGMRTTNISGLLGISSNINSSLDNDNGFGL